MSLFYAEATPMLKTLSDATTKFVSEVRIYIYGLDSVFKFSRAVHRFGDRTTGLILASRNPTCCFGTSRNEKCLS